MILQESDISKWFNTLDDCKPEYSPVKCFNLLQFFRLKGRTTNMTKTNIEPIPDLKYVVFSTKESRYYLKESREWDLDKLYFYRQTLDFSGNDEAVEQLRRYVYDGNVHLLFNSEQVADMSSILVRLYNNHFTNEGKLDYRRYIALLENSLKLEDYKDYGSNLTGFKTVCNQYSETIKKLWMESHIK